MSKHIGRKQRWMQETTTRFTSPQGTVLYEQNAWYAHFDYRLRSGVANNLPVWDGRSQRLGPYKRPRNAMVALEREVTMLQNRHGNDMLLGNQLWAEA
ncbi:MAG: hypothetical protein K2R98_16895 [Gemmataceae bacterium]|nr:hypothetical protein [Gemmataceae bacterium]